MCANTSVDFALFQLRRPLLRPPRHHGCMGSLLDTEAIAKRCRRRSRSAPNSVPPVHAPRRSGSREGWGPRKRGPRRTGPATPSGGPEAPTAGGNPPRDTEAGGKREEPGRSLCAPTVEPVLTGQPGDRERRLRYVAAPAGPTARPQHGGSDGGGGGPHTRTPAHPGTRPFPRPAPRRREARPAPSP
ncbi:unnamed protein product [Rangifer tarandus platyrhynchus]|uniref:Uncharacterized protein n=1 Tax=Rangifer tarandus platyrhynchus TaxID=3082113 RepID=A0ACB1MJN8_RANTA